MKVSFSLSSSSKNSSKPSSSSSSKPSSSSSSSDEPPNKEFITHFDPSNYTSKTPIIIPPIPNQWDPQTQPIDSGSNPTSSIDNLMLMKLKSDLQRLPDDGGVGEFEDVKVEDFAGAYMKGYGWCEGRGIGMNAKEDVKVVEFKNNVAGEGLGFVRTRNGDHKLL